MPARMQKAHLQNLNLCCMRKAMLVLRTRGMPKGDMFERRRRVAELAGGCRVGPTEFQSHPPLGWMYGFPDMPTLHGGRVT